MASVNMLLQGLMMHSDVDQIDFFGVKGVSAGGTALVKEIADEWKSRTSSQISEGYGFCETTAVLACNIPDSNRLGTMRVTMVAQEIKLIDDLWDTILNGHRGEICVRGAQVPHSYWQRQKP
jgi:long-chain acyl-CoA synthetase